MGKILDRIFHGLAVIAGLLLLFMTIAICWSIGARIIGVRGPIWVVQFTEYSLLWMTFLGAAWVLARNKHVSILIITQRLGAKANWVLNIIQGGMGIVLCAVLCYFGTLITWDQFSRMVIDVSSIDMPKYLVIMFIPFGFLLLLLQFIRNLAATIKARPVPAAGGSATSKSPSTQDSF